MRKIDMLEGRTAGYLNLWDDSSAEGEAGIACSLASLEALLAPSNPSEPTSATLQSWLAAGCDRVLICDCPV